MTITTREGREELRREHRLVNMYIPSEVKANLGLALDGLDIAEEMADALEWALGFVDPADGPPVLAGDKKRAARHLAKWEKWCS